MTEPSTPASALPLKTGTKYLRADVEDDAVVVREWTLEEFATWDYPAQACLTNRHSPTVTTEMVVSLDEIALRFVRTDVHDAHTLAIKLAMRRHIDLLDRAIGGLDVLLRNAGRILPWKDFALDIVNILKAVDAKEAQHGPQR